MVVKNPRIVAQWWTSSEGHLLRLYFGDYNDLNIYSDYRGRDLDLDLVWERFSESVTFSDTVDYYWQIAKLESWHWGVVANNQIVPWTAFTILAMFSIYTGIKAV